MSNTAKDLSQEPPRSPRTCLGGYVLAARMIDKGRADLSGSVGEYHFNCMLDSVLFKFKGVTGKEVHTLLALGATDEEVIEWINNNGTPRTAEEISTWSDSLLKEKDMFFDLLEADDRALLSKPTTSSLNIPRKAKPIQ